MGLRLREIADDKVAGPSVREGVQRLRELFDRPGLPGVDLTVRALSGAVPEPRVRALVTAYMSALISGYGPG